MSKLTLIISSSESSSTIAPKYILRRSFIMKIVALPSGIVNDMLSAAAHSSSLMIPSSFGASEVYPDWNIAPELCAMTTGVKVSKRREINTYVFSDKLYMKRCI